MALSPREITGVVLAGGRGRRMGGQDKGLVEVDGQPLISRILEVFAPQVGQIIINANRNHLRYRSFGYTLVADDLEDYQGPLAGFAAAMGAASTPFIITLPCDGPWLPTKYVSTMSDALEAHQAELVVAHDGGRLQPVYTLLPVSLRGSLLSFLAGGDRKIDLWFAKHKVATADFSHCPEAFRNINTPEDRNRWQA